MKKFLFFLFVTLPLLLCGSLFGQAVAALPDSLQLSIDTASNPRTKLEALFSAGDYFYGLYNTDGYNEATKLFNQALQISILQKDKEYEAAAYKALASVYDALGDENLPKALEYYKKHAEIAEVFFKTDSAFFVGANILVAHTYHKLKDIVACKNTIDRILNFLGTNKKYAKGRNRVALSAAYFMAKLDNYAYCKKYFESTSADTSYFTKTGVWNIPKYYHQVQVYLAAYRKDYVAAYNFGKKTLYNANNKSDSMEIFHQMADFAQNLKLYKEAFEYKKIETDLYREIVKGESLKSVDNKLLKSELFLKEENTKLLERQKKLQSQFNTWLIIGLGIVSILAGILFWFVTQRRKQNKILHLQNEEKAVLLGEIHHRVKNNLEMLQSMLILQMREYKDDENVQLALGEANNRIQSIALLHQQLYSGNLAKTNIRHYFTEMLARVMNDINQRRQAPVAYNLQLDDVELPPDTILPLALLINEWLTNSAKYAFAKNKADAAIQLTIKAQTNSITINYSDNGNNATAPYTQGTGFGSRLLNSLVRQLKGTLQLDSSSSGWHYTLSLPKT